MSPSPLPPDVPSTTRPLQLIPTGHTNTLLAAHPHPHPPHQTPTKPQVNVPNATRHPDRAQASRPPPPPADHPSSTHTTRPERSTTPKPAKDICPLSRRAARTHEPHHNRARSSPPRRRPPTVAAQDVCPTDAPAKPQVRGIRDRSRISATATTTPPPTTTHYSPTGTYVPLPGDVAPGHMSHSPQPPAAPRWLARKPPRPLSGASVLSNCCGGLGQRDAGPLGGRCATGRG